MEEQAELVKKLNQVIKLGLSRHETITLYNEDEHSQALKGFTNADYQDDSQYDAIFVHVYSIAEMADVFQLFADQGQLREKGQLYLVYPKLDNPVYPGIDRQDIFPGLHIDKKEGYFPETNFKFNVMASLNEVFSILGFKLMADREKTIDLVNSQPAAAANNAAQYQQFIPEMAAKLAQEDEVLRDKFQALPMAKQTEMAQDIYSARTSLNRVQRFYKLVNELKRL